MPGWPDQTRLSEAKAEGQSAARLFRLPFRDRVWSGLSGNWAGAGVGSSIDFQDHRPYTPGDDPRYINWQAYARTGNYSMKLYREEVSPTVDLVLDDSPSMFFEDSKARRTLELFFFAAESSLQNGSSLCVYRAGAGDVKAVPVESIRAGSLDQPGADGEEAGVPNLSRVPFRQGSLRVIITDLLFPTPPAEVVRTLAAGRGRGVILAPYCESESEPDWFGNIELVDCEGKGTRHQRIDSALLDRYSTAYQRHFELWTEESRRLGIASARVASRNTLGEVLRAEALSSGAVEPWT